MHGACVRHDGILRERKFDDCVTGFFGTSHYLCNVSSLKSHFVPSVAIVAGSAVIDYERCRPWNDIFAQLHSCSPSSGSEELKYLNI